MRIQVRVVPRSSKNTLEWQDGSLKVRLTAAPVDGAANKALITLLARHLHVPERAITLVRGATGRQKTLEITGITMEEVEQRLSTS